MEALDRVEASVELGGECRVNCSKMSYMQILSPTPHLSMGARSTKLHCFFFLLQMTGNLFAHLKENGMM